MSDSRFVEQEWDAEQDELDALASLDSLVDEVDVIPADEVPTTSVPVTRRKPEAGEQVSQPLPVMPQATTRTPARKTRQSTTVSQPTGRRSAASGNGTPRRSAKARARRDEGKRTLRRKPVPSQPYDPGYVPDQTGRFDSQPTPRKVDGRLSFVLLLAIMLLRLAAISLCFLVVAGAVPSLIGRLSIMEWSSLASRLLPSQLSGILVIQTPFGGAFRGDFAFAALVLYIIDWLLTRTRLRLG